MRKNFVQFRTGNSKNKILFLPRYLKFCELLAKVPFSRLHNICHFKSFLICAGKGYLKY